MWNRNKRFVLEPFKELMVSPKASKIAYFKLSALKRSVHISNRACLRLPVADLCPPETGHRLFQVLPQVSDVLHCPHASRLRILSWKRKFDIIYWCLLICALEQRKRHLTSGILLRVSMGTEKDRGGIRPWVPALTIGTSYDELACQLAALADCGYNG